MGYSSWRKKRYIFCNKKQKQKNKQYILRFRQQNFNINSFLSIYNCKAGISNPSIAIYPSITGRWQVDRIPWLIKYRWSLPLNSAPAALPLQVPLPGVVQLRVLPWSHPELPVPQVAYCSHTGVDLLVGPIYKMTWQHYRKRGELIYFTVCRTGVLTCHNTLPSHIVMSLKVLHVHSLIMIIRMQALSNAYSGIYINHHMSTFTSIKFQNIE